MADLSTSFLGIAIVNPLVVASGPLTDQEKTIRRMLAGGAGAVVSKTIHPSPPQGLDERILRIPTGMLNSTTYSQRSVADWCDTLKSLAHDNLPVVASIHADSPAELAVLATKVEDTGIRALELGISCINEAEELEDTPQRVGLFVEAVRGAVRIPFSVKLAIGEMIQDRISAAMNAGANAVTLSDTISGLSVDAQTGQIQLNGSYGYSGPGIKPLVQSAIYELRKQGFNAEISGTGGASNETDIVEYMSVGASTVQIYTALHSKTFETLDKIVMGLHRWFDDNGLSVADVLNRSFRQGG
jgi:dihydroorotate dehydrogenase subfamily 1